MIDRTHSGDDCESRSLTSSCRYLPPTTSSVTSPFSSDKPNLASPANVDIAKEVLTDFDGEANSGYSCAIRDYTTARSGVVISGNSTSFIRICIMNVSLNTFPCSPVISNLYNYVTALNSGEIP